MLLYFGLAVLGILVGMIGTLIGAGGGFILAPILLLVYPKESTDTVTSISLCVVFFNALSGSRAYAQMKRIDFPSGILFSMAGVPGAILGAITSSHIPRRPFDLAFGGLMIATCVFLIGSAAKRPTMTPGAPGGSAAPDSMHATHRLTPRNRAIGIGLSALVGYVSSLLGIGGGIVHVPVLTHILGFPVHTATATSHFVLAITALVGTVTHIATGVFHHGFRRAAALSVGVLLGAPFGARLSSRLHAAWITRGLAVALGFVGLRILLKAL
jgi:uncharacterized protein